jgi:microcompartment protein CcmK/EutM
MLIGKVIGTVVSTVKHPILEGYKVLIVQPVTPEGKNAGKTELALDTVQAGVGETVLLLSEGNSARMIVGDRMGPVRAVIVGIIDHVQYAGEKNG